MNDEKQYLVKDLNLISLVEWFNQYYAVKKSGEEFTVSDVQGYVKRKRVPFYLGGEEIEINSEKVKGVRSYSIIKNESKDGQ